MVDLDRDRETIRRILTEYSGRRYAYRDIVNETVFDLVNDRYLVVSQGWERPRRIHSVLIHLDLIGDKIWVQRDGTEEGVVGSGRDSCSGERPAG